MKNTDKFKLLIELELTMSTCEICQGINIFDANGDLVIDKCICEDNPIKEYAE
ncbi:MAG TPA: hypothetical protein GX530_09685 [Corynebacteriales bacterium]|nr:hypothetical protein [Mycobacteriales bacterium]